MKITNARSLYRRSIRRNRWMSLRRIEMMLSESDFWRKSEINSCEKQNEGKRRKRDRRRKRQD